MIRDVHFLIKLQSMSLGLIVSVTILKLSLTLGCRGGSSECQNLPSEDSEMLFSSV